MSFFGSVWSGVKKAKDAFVSLPPVKKVVAVSLTTTAVGFAGVGGVLMATKNTGDKVSDFFYGKPGHFILVNGTDKEWQLANKQSNFPDRIKSGEVKTVDINLGGGFPIISPRSPGAVKYKLVGTEQTFEIRKTPNGRDSFEAVFTNLTIENKSKGETINLEEEDKGYRYFILSGEKGNYIGNGLDTANWMQNNKALIGDRRLIDICIPGSHDSGMSQVTWEVPGSRQSETITHTKNIGGQLELGTRFFDIRPVNANGSYYTAHLQEQNIQVAKFLGATGQSLDDIIKQVNDFTQNHDELVILNVSHTANIDKNDINKEPVDFNQSDWDKLIRYLNSNVKRLVLAPADADLSRMKLNELLKKDQEVIVLVAEDRFSALIPSELHGKGFFSKEDNFTIFDQYADKKEVKEMKDDQIEKLKKQELQYFLLSWTLTQSWAPKSIVGNLLETNDSILKLASEANGQLATIYEAVGRDTFPNIIYTDNIHNDQQAALAMAINWKRTVFPNYDPKPLVTVYEAPDFAISNSNPYEDFNELEKILPIEKYVKNDMASSIKVASGYKVTLYEDINGGGKQVVIDGDTEYDKKDCNGWASLPPLKFSDTASSLKIEKKPQPSVFVYKDADFSEASDEFYELDKLLVFDKNVKNDMASSIKVASGYKATLYENTDGSGKQVVIDGDEQYDKTGYKGWANLPPFDFNDQASGLKIERKTQAPDVDNDEVSGSNIESPNQSAVIVYEGADFSDKSDEFNEVGKILTLNKNVGNDKMTSIKVASGYRVTLYENNVGTGKELVIDGDTEYNVKGSKGWANLSPLNFAGIVSNLKIEKK